MDFPLIQLGLKNLLSELCEFIAKYTVWNRERTIECEWIGDKWISGNFFWVQQNKILTIFAKWLARTHTLCWLPN